MNIPNDAKVVRRDMSPARRRKRRYCAWKCMIYRCSDYRGSGRSRLYDKREYFDRGIRVCERWLNSFEDYLSDMGYPPAEGMSIDRIDNNKGYYKENCRWATAQEQQLNTNSVIPITYIGETLPLSRWARRFRTSGKIMRERFIALGIFPMDRQHKAELEEDRAHSR